MLSSSDLKNAIISRIQNLTDATDALQKLSAAVESYVKANAELSFSWIASGPGGPDPITSAKGKFTSFPISLTPSGSSEYNDSQSHFESECNAGIASAQFNITDIGFTTAPAAVGAPVTLELSIPQTSSSDEAIGELASDIVDWIKSQQPVSPVSGTHGAYSGAGTVTSIV